VLRIKQLVFEEGLTLAGARRRLEETRSAAQEADTVDMADLQVAEVVHALAADARTRIAYVRDGLRSILNLLSSAPGTVVVVDDFALQPPAGDKPSQPQAVESGTATKRKRASA